jgi:hypothetical protein
MVLEHLELPLQVELQARLPELVPQLHLPYYYLMTLARAGQDRNSPSSILYRQTACESPVFPESLLSARSRSATFGSGGSQTLQPPRYMAQLSGLK